MLTSDCSEYRMIFFTDPQVAASSASAEFQPVVPCTAPLPEASHDQFVAQGILLGRHSTFKNKNDKLVQADMLKVNV